MRHARGERGMIGLAAAVASVVIVAVIGGALLVHAYSDTVRNLTRKDSIGYLADISSQITENVRTVTSQIFSAMETIERGQMTLVENGATLDELNGEMAEDRDLLYQLIGQVIHLLFYGDHLKDIDDKSDHNSGDQDINKGTNIGRFPFLRF